mgnify:CR=1 FL=1
MRTHVYVDGFYFYNGYMRGTPYKWLNLEKFSDLMLPLNDVPAFKCFTARVEARPGDPEVAHAYCTRRSSSVSAQVCLRSHGLRESSAATGEARLQAHVQVSCGSPHRACAVFSRR